MELWFVLTIISAISGGLFVFLVKVGVERDYDVVLVNTVPMYFSALLLFVATFFWSDYSGFTLELFLYALASGLLYLIGNMIRHKGLQCIDTAIFYPIYKTLTPLLAVLFGILWLGERFTTTEVIGLGISILVPLFLVTNAEQSRQKNLIRGLQLLVLASLVALIVAAISKFGVDAVSNVWLFTAVATLATAIGATVLTIYKNRSKLDGSVLVSITPSFVGFSLFMGLFNAGGVGALFFAFLYGPFGIVYTIQSLYILIPIVLSIIFYNEHWNARKVAAIVLSIAALGLLH